MNRTPRIPPSSETAAVVTISIDSPRKATPASEKITPAVSDEPADVIVWTMLFSRIVPWMPMRERP